MPGKIARIAVTYTVDTPDGPRRTCHGLSHMRRHVRPDRLIELLDDLTVICEHLVAARQPAPGTGLAGLPGAPGDRR
jgi:hypothetical protein